MPEPQDIAALREVAEAATPGPWEAVAMGSEGYHVKAPSDHPIRRTTAARCTYEDWQTDRANAEFIAATSPDVVLALVSEVERGRALRAAVEALAEEWERTTVPSRLAFLVCADELKDLLAAHVPSPLPVGGAAGAGEGS